MKKKIFTIILLTVVSFALVACGGENDNKSVVESSNERTDESIIENEEPQTSGKKAIVGEWKSYDGEVLIFNKNGKLDSGTPWEYDKETDTYSYVSHVGLEISFKIEEDDGIRSIFVGVGEIGEKYYFIDDYEKAVAKENELIVGEWQSESGKIVFNNDFTCEYDNVVYEWKRTGTIFLEYELSTDGNVQYIFMESTDGKYYTLYTVTTHERTEETTIDSSVDRFTRAE